MLGNARILVMNMHVERLEPRTLLSAGAPGDAGATPAAALDLGTMSGVRKVSESLSAADRVDCFRFAVKNRGNVNITLTRLVAGVAVELLDSRLRLIARSSGGAGAVLRVSRSLAKGSYFVRVSGTGAATAYGLTIQADLNWTTAKNGSLSAAVGLVFASGSTRAISAARDTWIIIHGWTGSPSGIADVAAAIDSISPSDQVLALDWSDPASGDMFSAFSWVPAVARAAAATINRWGIDGSRINLVGHSMGGYLAGALADALPDGVNRIIALDPATDPWGALVDYADRSQYSLAFIAGDMATRAAAFTAHEAFRLDMKGLGSLLSHMAVLDFFATLMRTANGASPDRVSALFAVDRLVSGADRPWQYDAYDDGYEGVMEVGESGGHWRPRNITYRDSSGREVTLRA